MRGRNAILPPIIACLLGSTLLLLALSARAAGNGTEGGQLLATPIQTRPIGETIPPEPTRTPTRAPTNTPLPYPTGTPRPTEPGAPTTSPVPTPPGATPTRTPTPDPQVYVIDVAAPVPPEPVPAPWVGVSDYLVRNVEVRYGNTVVWQGEWVESTNPSLYEHRAFRREGVEANPVSQGDMRPPVPDDNVLVVRPQCLVNGEWWYVAGEWYYNGVSDVVVDGTYYRELLKYGPPEYPEPFQVEVRYHYAYVPEPDFPVRTWWNFGATYQCDQAGGGGGGGGGQPTPTPPPPPPSPTPPPAQCPSCSCTVQPPGSFESPHLVPWDAITITWDTTYGPGAALTGYTARARVFDGTGWTVIGRQDLTPDEPRQASFPVLPGVLHHAWVDVLFDLEGHEESCCSCSTFYRYSLEFVPPEVSPVARADYWSRRDPGSSAANPRRTSGSTLKWPWGEFLHVHPTAEFELLNPSPDWTAEVNILRWRYRGSLGEDRPTEWFEEGPPPYDYVHLLWTRYDHPTAQPDTFIYATEPALVDVTYDLETELVLTHVPTGQRIVFSPIYYEGMVLQVHLTYSYQTAPW